MRLHWQPSRLFDSLHNRAAFHFLTEIADPEDFLRVCIRLCDQVAANDRAGQTTVCSRVLTGNLAVFSTVPSASTMNRHARFK